MTSNSPCSTCGNTYDKAFTVTVKNLTYTFDCIECAAEKLAPACHRCGCRILGHGIEGGGVMFCGAHCARENGVAEARDRVA